MIITVLTMLIISCFSHFTLILSFHPSLPPKDKEPFISQRVDRLVKAGVINSLVLFKKSQSASTNELLARWVGVEFNKDNNYYYIIIVFFIMIIIVILQSILGDMPGRSSQRVGCTSWWC